MKTLKIEGMSCQHCVKRVKTSLETMFPEATVTVDLKSNSATLEGANQINEIELKVLLEDLGYPLLELS